MNIKAQIEKEWVEFKKNLVGFDEITLKPFHKAFITNWRIKNGLRKGLVG